MVQSEASLQQQTLRELIATKVARRFELDLERAELNREVKALIKELRDADAAV